MLEQLQKMLAQYVRIRPSQITEETILRSDLGLSSLSLMSLVAEVEEEFEVEISETDILQFQTVGDVIAYLESVKAEN